MEADDIITSSQDTESLDATPDMEEDNPTPLLPINCPEKIIVVMDTSSEMKEALFKANGTDEAKIRSKLFWVKKCVEMFLRNKSLLNAHHQFALVLLQENTCFWYQEFTSNVSLLIESLADVDAAQEKSSPLLFPLDVLLREIHNNCVLPEKIYGGVAEYVVRVVFVYGRSNPTVVTDKCRQMFQHLRRSPVFFFDALYVEGKNADESTKDWLHGLDERDDCYFVHGSRSPAQLFENMAKLLAHPLQRSIQKHSCHEF
ncbi:BRISC and BRCA1-A complex member 1-like isoform X2 [Hydractinia symbiolongicarpus]|nr:BRISC and BRCA1-A complex member 1-like isoform X2 [Hydractinia symbiolongicarpus]